MLTVEQSTGPMSSSLSEDLATRWVPDVIADADLLNTSSLASATLTRQDALPVQVPSSGGRHRTVWQLSGRALWRLHEATDNLRSTSDALLHPNVCGYRRGADRGSAYSGEYRRFKSLTETSAHGSHLVLSTDVSNFFASLKFETISRIVFELAGEVASKSIASILQEFRDIGVSELPAGYADTRLIANVMLAAVDRTIPYEFTRWVDDYRIFVQNKEQASLTLDFVDGSLGQLGLSRSLQKTLLESIGAYGKRKMGRPLDSVYHPQDDSPGETYAALRTVLVDGMSRQDRRLIRFALPRMREVGDDFGVPLAIAWLRTDPSDAPRIVDYLSAFVEDVSVQRDLESLLQQSDPWLLARIAPLFAAFEPSDRAWDAIDAIITNADLPVAARELYVRVAAMRGSLRHSVFQLQSEWLPVRTAVASALDMNDLDSARAASQGSGLFECLLALAPLPAPSPRSIL